MLYLLVVVGGAILVMMFVWHRSVEKGRDDYEREMVEFGLTEYHHDLMKHASKSDDFRRRFMLFTMMMCVMERFKAQAAPTLLPNDPLEDGACRELIRIGLLDPAPDGAGYRRTRRPPASGV
jgi:hypothetical protein